MGACRVLLAWILHYAGLYFQVNASLSVEHGQVDNHIFGNAVFTEVPSDVWAEVGADVEMSCSFRGAGSPSFSLEIQWWYIKDRTDQAQTNDHISNQVVPLEETSKDATKISVVRVAGSNISHKLRLSSVRPSDGGVYECRVIDFSGTEEQQYTTRGYLHIQNHPTDMQHIPETKLLNQPQDLRGAGGLERISAPNTDCSGTCGL